METKTPLAFIQTAKGPSIGEPLGLYFSLILYCPKIRKCTYSPLYPQLYKLRYFNVLIPPTSPVTLLSVAHALLPAMVLMTFDRGKCPNIFAWCGIMMVPHIIWHAHWFSAKEDNSIIINSSEAALPWTFSFKRSSPTHNQSHVLTAPSFPGYWMQYRSTIHVSVL